MLRNRFTQQDESISFQLPESRTEPLVIFVLYLPTKVVPRIAVGTSQSWPCPPVSSPAFLWLMHTDVCL